MDKSRLNETISSWEAAHRLPWMLFSYYAQNLGQIYHFFCHADQLKLRYANTVEAPGYKQHKRAATTPLDHPVWSPRDILLIQNERSWLWHAQNTQDHFLSLKYYQPTYDLLKAEFFWPACSARFVPCAGQYFGSKVGIDRAMIVVLLSANDWKNIDTIEQVIVYKIEYTHNLIINP